MFGTERIAISEDGMGTYYLMKSAGPDVGAIRAAGPGIDVLVAPDLWRWSEGWVNRTLSV